MTDSFVQRKIDVSFTLAGGKTFAESGTDTAELSGLRTSCYVENAGGRGFGMLHLKVWGMTLSMMNQLSTLGIRIQLVPHNTIVVKAGDDTNGMSIVFTGIIYSAYFDGDNAPDTPFIVEAQAALFEGTMTMKPTSIQGTSDVATVLQGLANAVGWDFTNDGVQAKIENLYLYGSPREQMARIVDHAKINWNGGFKNVLAIWPKNGHRGSTVVQIDPDHGMIGYPSFTAEGILVRCLFNPNVDLGGQIQVKSQLERANGVWTIYSLDYTLEANMPGGQWMMEVLTYDTKTVPALPVPIRQ